MLRSGSIMSDQTGVDNLDEKVGLICTKKKDILGIALSPNPRIVDSILGQDGQKHN